MLRANDENNKDVYITDSDKDSSYHCPICNASVIRKMGNGVRRPHFAHKSSVEAESCDGWHYDMSDWHRDWQEKFPTECQEVVVEFEGKKHRADVLIEDKKLVIEFQHSRLSAEEYADRNEFYKKSGYDIIWLFDMTDDYREERFVYQEDDNMYLWKRPWNTFRGLDGDSESQANFRWKTNVNSVFFQNGVTVEQLIDYKPNKRLVKTSSLLMDDKYYWSDFTFENWLKRMLKTVIMYKPKCRVCKEPMEFRQYSQTLDFFWGCKNYYSDKKCKERIDIPGVWNELLCGGRCPFCNGKSDPFMRENKLKCSKCGMSIRIVEI